MRAHVGMGLPTKEDVERIVVYVILSLFGCFFGRSHFYMCFKMFFRLLLGMGGNKSVPYGTGAVLLGKLWLCQYIICLVFA